MTEETRGKGTRFTRLTSFPDREGRFQWEADWPNENGDWRYQMFCVTEAWIRENYPAAEIVIPR